MKRLALLLVLFATPAAADQCDDAARAAAAAAKGSVRDRKGDIIRLRVRGEPEIELGCTAGRVVRVRGVLQEGSALNFVRLMGQAVGGAFDIPAARAASDLGGCVGEATARAGVPVQRAASIGMLDCFVREESVVLEVTRL